MRSNYDGWWYIFMLFIFPTAFIIAPLTTHLGFVETLNFVDWYISGYTWGWVGTLLYIPVGIVTYLMPNDIGYFFSAFLLIFMQGGIFVIYIFFATTYPPGTKFREENVNLITQQD